MDSLLPIDISATALSTQRLRMAVIATNLANIHTTRTPEGGPYRRRALVVQAEPLPEFQRALERELARGATPGLSPPARLAAHLRGVRPAQVVIDTREPIWIHAPTHPEADRNGNVAMPNISVMEEMVDMIATSRAYEANLAVLRATKRMVTQALEIGRR